MSASSSDSEMLPVGKKRTKNADKYKRNVIRGSKVKGVEYVNWKGDKIQCRSTGDDCK